MVNFSIQRLIINPSLQEIYVMQRNSYHWITVAIWDRKGGLLQAHIGQKSSSQVHQGQKKVRIFQVQIIGMIYLLVTFISKMFMANQDSEVNYDYYRQLCPNTSEEK